MSPLAQVLRGVAAVAVLLIAGAAAAEYFFHDKIPYLHRAEKVGVPIGVPDAARFASTPATQPVIANQPSESSPPPVIADANQQPPAVVEQNETPSPAPSDSVTTNQIASANKPSEPASPAVGPSESPAAENPDQSSVNESSESTNETRRKGFAASRRPASDNPRATRSESNDDVNYRGPAASGRGRARIIGRTPDGRPIVKLTSGRVVILQRYYDDNGIYPSRPRRRVYSERPDDYVPPIQPFDPND